MRHKEPEHVALYNFFLKSGAPKCCHTCEHYNDDGLCVTYNMEPPEEFAATEGSCDKWSAICPF